MCVTPRSLCHLPPLATVRVKDKMCHEECRQGAHLPSLGREPIDKPLNSATRGQSDARPTVTFPAAGHHRPLTGTELNCLAAEAHVCVNNLPTVVTWNRHGRESNPRPVESRVQRCNHYTFTTRLMFSRHVSFMQICDCRIFRTLTHFSHISAKYAAISHMFFSHKLAFRRQFQYFSCFCYLFLLHFVTSTIWLPTECHHPCVRTPVKRDGVVGFKQFCTTFLPHIWCLCGPHIFYRAMLCIRGTSHGPVSVCLSVTSRCSIETDERIELGFLAFELSSTRPTLY